MKQYKNTVNTSTHITKGRYFFTAS